MEVAPGSVAKESGLAGTHSSRLLKITQLKMKFIFQTSIFESKQWQSFEALEHFSQWGSNSEILTAEDKDQCDLDVVLKGGELAVKCVSLFMCVSFWLLWFILKTFLLLIDHYDLWSILSIPCFFCSQIFGYLKWEICRETSYRDYQHFDCFWFLYLFSPFDPVCSMFCFLSACILSLS